MTLAHPTNVPGRGNDRGTGTAELRLAASTTGRTHATKQPSQPRPPAGHPSTRAAAPRAASGAPGAAHEALLTPAETARLFGAPVKAVTGLVRAGVIPAEAVVRTPGGHRRYREAAIRNLLAGTNPLSLLATQQAAGMLHIATNTLMRWERDGKIGCTRTPGGHRRFDPADVRALMASRGRHP